MVLEVKQVEKVSTMVFPKTTICIQIVSKSLIQKGFLIQVLIREKNETIRNFCVLLEADLELTRRRHNFLIDFYLFLGGIIIN